MHAVFVEKILRVQPYVKRLYLLLRAADTKSATDRMHDQIIGKELFRVLKDKWGTDFDSFIAEKVVAVAGDVTFDDLGVKELKYDIALSVNTFGVQHGLKFVNKAFGGYFQDLYVNYNQKLKLVMRLVELYEPYMLFKGIFDDNNAEELRRITRERFVDAEAFNFDARCIDWEDYIIHTHIPGLQKHVMMKR
ncbi:fatty acyl-CoA reductase 3-like [Prunus yedoensis var. nudiflora]|uniref:Fatty acyl-CoA reductase n=1 Tax=Prunus yedoensis var. nudiflora TaxID=2094558 RepID=A0A314XH52_PRUYE|nr:fatty acyl-CoA reductase 3-like [Prunus yedoensis var. nudiflora]